MTIHELTHIILSLIIGAVGYRYYKSFWVFVAAFATGFFLDVDHLFDYFVFHRGLHFNLHEIATGSWFDIFGRVYLPLHSYELCLILVMIGVALISKKQSKYQPAAVILLVLGFALFSHLVYDTLYYKPDWQTYFFVYRAFYHFDLASFNFR